MVKVTNLMYEMIPFVNYDKPAGAKWLSF